MIDSNAVWRMLQAPKQPVAALPYAKQLAGVLDKPQELLARVVAHQFGVFAPAVPSAKSGYSFGWAVSQPLHLSLSCLARPASATLPWQQVILRQVEQAETCQTVLWWLARLPDAPARIADMPLDPAPPPLLPASLGAAAPADWRWQGKEIIPPRASLPVWGEDARLAFYIKLPPGEQVMVGTLVRWVRVLAGRTLARKSIPRTLQGDDAPEWL